MSLLGCLAGPAVPAADTGVKCLAAFCNRPPTRCPFAQDMHVDPRVPVPGRQARREGASVAGRGSGEQVRCGRVRDPAEGPAAPVRGPLAGCGPGPVQVLPHPGAGRQLPRRAGPRGAAGPGVRPGHRRARPVGRTRTGGRDVVSARGGVCGDEMAVPGGSLASQPGRGAGHRHPRADRARARAAAGGSAASRVVRVCLQPGPGRGCGRGDRAGPGLGREDVAAGHPAR
jgi:hypothetical protein